MILTRDVCRFSVSKPACAPHLASAGWGLQRMYAIDLWDSRNAAVRLERFAQYRTRANLLKQVGVNSRSLPRL